MPALTTSDPRARMVAALRHHVGADIEVTSLDSLSAGASAETWKATITGKGGDRTLIIQVMAASSQFPGGLVKSQQAPLQRAVHGAGGLVPEVLFSLDAEDGLGDGFAMAFVAGETLAPRILRRDEYAHARTVLAAQCGQALAAIHRMPLLRLPPLHDRGPLQSVDQLESTYRTYANVSPVFEVAFRWLRANPPALRPHTLVHGDFRIGNLIVDADGLKAVLDWELSHVGDPSEDLALISVPAWRFGNLDKPIGGFSGRDDFYSAYEAAGGRPVDRTAVGFWEVFGTLKWGVICLFFAHQHLSGEVRSVERVAIGRRVSETELDLLSLMDAR